MSSTQFALPDDLLNCRSCHLGKTIIYDTVTNLSWSVDIRTHGIVNVIERILSEPWAPSVEVGREVPLAKAEEDCVVSASSMVVSIFAKIPFTGVL